VSTYLVQTRISVRQDVGDHDDLELQYEGFVSADAPAHAALKAAEQAGRIVAEKLAVPAGGEAR
jgi:hypothetical protein